MKIKQNFLHVVGIYTVFALICLVFLVPLLWTFFSSLRPHAEIFQYSYPLSLHTFIPIEWTVDNYLAVLIDKGFGLFLLNSLFVAIVMVISSWFVNSMGAYAFSRSRFKGKEALYFLVLFTMMVPIEATVVPTYTIVKNMGLYYSLWALIIPWIAEPFGIFLLRQFIDGIPRDLDDAAKVDGCSFWQIYWHVILPNITSAQITLAIMKFIWAWSAFFWPLVITESRNNMTIQVGIATLTTKEVTYWGQTFAGVMVSVIPVIVVFLSLQRYYIEGITMSGIKG